MKVICPSCGAVMTAKTRFFDPCNQDPNQTLSVIPPHNPLANNSVGADPAKKCPESDMVAHSNNCTIVAP